MRRATEPEIFHAVSEQAEICSEAYFSRAASQLHHASESDALFREGVSTQRCGEGGRENLHVVSQARPAGCITQDSLNPGGNLARTAHADARYEEAEEIYQWALKVSEAILGSESANTIFLRDRYAHYLQLLGYEEEATRLGGATPSDE